MRSHRISFLGILALGLAAALGSCNPFGGDPAVQLDPSGPDLSSWWNATLTSPSTIAGLADIQGRAWMRPTGETMEATIEIRNAAPGGVHPWGVYRGRCGSAGRIVGSDDAYEPLRIGDEGTATRTADLDVTLQRSQSYAVLAVASPTNRDLVVACGNLAPPSG